VLASLNYVAIGIFVIVYGLIALRNLRWFRIPVWTVMLAGAVAMIFTNSVPLDSAYSSVNLNVILFLVGMFTVVAAMDLSGLLEYATLRIISLAKTPQRAFALIIAGMGAMSTFLMNDTLALMATPIMINLSRKMGIKPGVLLVALAMGITVGSVMTPVGNPQNLLIAISSQIPNPFFSFLHYLFLPTIACLIATYLILRIFYGKELSLAGFTDQRDQPQDAIKDRKLARISGYTVVIVVLGFFVVGAAQFFGFSSNANLGTVALLGATIIYMVSSRRREILRSVDWGIIVFFISLFIFTEALWESNLLQTIMAFLPAPTRNDQAVALGGVIVTSVLLSQLISNVPFVAVYIKGLQAAGFSGADVKIWMALAGASTLAGGLSLLGAASNVIILEEAEHKGEGFGFLEFLKAGILVTIPNILILWLFLTVL